MENTLILSASMPRSASTWLFNVARLALSKVDGLDLGSGWIDELETFSKHDVVLVKIHNYDEDLMKKAAGITYSFRDIRDGMASMKRKFGVEPDMNLVDSTIKSDVAWRRKASVVMKYEDFLVSKTGFVEQTLGMFGIEGLDIEGLISELDGLVAGSNLSELTGHDSVNLLHPGHVTDGRQGSWDGVLDPAFVKEIEKRYDWWLHENGYEY